MYVKTVGFACSKGSEYPCFPVDERHIIGDESEAFLNYIDALIRVGDGNQSIHDCEVFKRLYPGKPIEELSDSDIAQLSIK